jgi:hypothetical protein
MLKLSLIIILLLSIISFNTGFSQETTATVPETLSPDTIGQGVEKAIRNIEAEKEKAQETLKLNLQSKLKKAIDDWILAKKEEKALWLNKFVEQEWEFIPKFGPRGHYDYYLRSFNYEIGSSDIVKTDSLVSPYIGYLEVSERLYAERYHSPHVSYREDFLYTIRTPMRIKFEYNGADFMPVDVKCLDSAMENSWPEEVRKEVFKKIF